MDAEEGNTDDAGPRKRQMKTLEAGDVLDGVRSLTPRIRSECVDLDSTGVVPASIIDDLRHLGTFRSLAPRDIGGGEVDPMTFLRIVEEASYADGSVGWCVMIGGCYSTFAGLLPLDGGREIYGDAMTISAGAFRPSGEARRVDGGFHVSGRWQLGSGSSHANWFLGGCTVIDGDGPVRRPSGAPVFKEMFFPASQVTIIDNWDSTGLRGTASHDYTVTDIFVPDRRAMWFSDSPTSDHSLYAMPVVGVFASYVAAVPLGIGRHAIDTFMTLARGKTPGSSTTLLADKPVTHGARSGACPRHGRTQEPDRHSRGAVGGRPQGPQPHAHRSPFPLGGGDPGRPECSGRDRDALRGGRGQQRVRHLSARSMLARRSYSRPAHRPPGGEFRALRARAPGR
jgi:alkylation response protein AidB-like acyl-CoA dehydrogenase